MKIENLEISKIILYEGNCKLHPEWQVEQIKSSIEEFGYNDPVAVDEKNVIIEGHGRYLALKELGYKSIEVIRLSHLSEEQKRVYILVHNKACMSTGFDSEKLAEELEKIKIDGNVDISLTGFSEFELENILNMEENQLNLDEILSDVPKEDKKEPKTCPHCGGLL